MVPSIPLGSPNDFIALFEILSVFLAAIINKSFACFRNYWLGLTSYSIQFQDIIALVTALVVFKSDSVIIWSPAYIIQRKLVFNLLRINFHNLTRFYIYDDWIILRKCITRFCIISVLQFWLQLISW